MSQSDMMSIEKGIESVKKFHHHDEMKICLFAYNHLYSEWDHITDYGPNQEVCLGVLTDLERDPRGDASGRNEKALNEWRVSFEYPKVVG